MLRTDHGFVHPDRLGARLLLMLALVLGFVAVAPTATHATPLDVCPSGCTYSGIQAAVDAAASGDTITVGAGSYNEFLSINKSLTLKGAGAAQIKIDAGRGGNGNDTFTGGTGVDSFDGGPGTGIATDFNSTEGDAETNIP